VAETAGPGRASPPLVLAHRGAHRHVPENGLAAFRAALALPGCAGLEFDVRHAADGTPIVLHDESLARVQGIDRPAAQLTIDELATHGVPTLAALLALCPPSAFLDMELKEAPSARTLAPLRVARAAPDGSLARAVLSGFDPDHLRAARALQPGWPCWLNVEVRLGVAEIEAAREAGCSGISADWRLISPATAAAVRAAGLVLAAWTVRRRPTLARLARLGVVAVCAEGRVLG
jgi:glycerophosphoryl diester phosphodiesterase